VRNQAFQNNASPCRCRESSQENEILGVSSTEAARLVALGGRLGSGNTVSFPSRHHLTASQSRGTLSRRTNNGKVVSTMTAALLATRNLTGRREFLVTFDRSMMGRALRAMVDLGITREIRCYPGRRMLLLEGELEALRQADVTEDEAVPVL